MRWIRREKWYCISAQQAIRSLLLKNCPVYVCEMPRFLASYISKVSLTGNKDITAVKKRYLLGNTDMRSGNENRLYIHICPPDTGGANVIVLS